MSCDTAKARNTLCRSGGFPAPLSFVARSKQTDVVINAADAGRRVCLTFVTAPHCLSLPLPAKTRSVDGCATCCADEADTECTSLDSDWEFYASTLFFVCLCCCFSVLCGFTEVRRKKKGISFAEAWSVPQAIPILRTWPRRSLSASDILPAERGGEERPQWSPLSDDEEDLKSYPVAGLVDDSSVAFGFVTSLPQSLLGTVTTSLRHADPARHLAPPSPQEPEVTVWVGREGQLEGAIGQGGVVGRIVEARGGRDERTRRDRGSQEDEEERGVAVGNDLQEPLIFGDDGSVPGRATVEGGNSGEWGEVESRA